MSASSWDDVVPTVAAPAVEETGRWSLTTASLVLDGRLGGKPVHVVLRKSEVLQFRLKTRGFHWINEYPFNR